MNSNNYSIDKRMLVYGLNKSYTDIFCFSTTRHGGCGTELYSSFNCTHYCGDSMENVLKNREILLGSLPCRPYEIIIPRQIHGTDILSVDEDFLSCNEETRNEYLEGVDAVVTACRGLCICVSTADCIPILLYDSRNRCIAAIHAGWRGTVERIVEKVIKKMNGLYGTLPQDIHAVIGPGISLLSFEVGDEVYDAFFKAGFDMDIIAMRYDKWHIDLWEANRLQLKMLGVLDSNIEVCGICTYTNHEDFFSARRLGIKSGRILSGIMLNL